MNWKVRMRNPWFWVGIVSAVVSALRVDVNALTSWGAVWSCLAGIKRGAKICVDAQKCTLLQNLKAWQTC